MEWIIGLFFILGIINAILDGLSQSINDSTTTGGKDRKRTDIEPLKGQSKRHIASQEKQDQKARELQQAKERAIRKLQLSKLKSQDIEKRCRELQAKLQAQKNIQENNISDTAVSQIDKQWEPDSKPPPYREIPQWIQDQSDSDIEIAFKEYGVLSVWHMTHIDNIKEILNSGILNNKAAYKIKKPTDISNHGVQRWRERKDPIYGRSLHEYAPTYINIKNPMLYVRRDIQHKLCLIEISLNALSKHNFIITDGNAASRSTRFYNSKSDLNKLPWDVLRAAYWNDFPDGKRKRCSEVLIYPKIDPKHIAKLHCLSSEARQYLSRFGVPVTITEKLFFAKYPTESTSAFSSFDDDTPF